MKLPMAAVQQLLGHALIEHSESLPMPQRDALHRSLGLIDGPAPDLFLIGLAVLGAMADLAHEQPLICLVDDEQWLDRASASVLTFVARRLDAEAVGIVFATRGDSPELAGLPERVVQGLDDRDSGELLDSVLACPIDQLVRQQIISECRGNPLALRELPRGMTTSELAGGFALAAAMPLTGRIENAFVRQLASLPRDTRRLLQIAAADPTGERLLVWRAAERLGISECAASLAVEAELIELGMRLRFRHPLIRSAAYRSGTLEERQEAHGALADSTDPELDPDRRAWHRGQAVQGSDEQVASDLESSAGRARARGGLVAAAAFLSRAVALTPEPERRARRAVAAAEAMVSAGSPNEAVALLSVAEQSKLDEPLRAQVELVRAFAAFSAKRGSDAPQLLLAAAKRLEQLDAARARDTYLDAVRASLYAGRFGTGGLLVVAQAARNAPPAPDPSRPTDLLLEGLALARTEGLAAGASQLKRAIAVFSDEDADPQQVLTYGDIACFAASILWDDRWARVSERMVTLTRAAGAAGALPLALTVACGWRITCGDLPAATTLLHEIEAVAAATGTEPPVLASSAVVAWRGDERTAVDHLGGLRAVAAERGEGLILTHIDWMTAVLYNGLGKYTLALEAATAAWEYRGEMWSPRWLHELIEAAARGGQPHLAEEALDGLSEVAAVAGSAMASGLEARCRALLADGDTADARYREAIEQLSRTPARVELGRAHLLYGEHLHQERRQLDAREQLHMAHDLFSRMGVLAFAERTSAALRASGENIRSRTAELRDVLTGQERQIAHLASEGLTSKDVGAQLFLSHRTVEWHLHNVFTKLGISSRKELNDALTSSQPMSVSPATTAPG